MIKAKTIQRAKLVTSILCVCVCLVVAVAVFYRARSARLDFDGAYNLQIGTSLAKDFVYRNNYHPFQIYDLGITTNGPVQYLLALALQFFDIDLARCAVVFIIYVSFIAATFWLSPLSALIASFLALAWPALSTASVSYMGDLTAATFCIAGFMVCQSWVQRPRRSFPVWAGVLFGFSIATKFITVGFVPLLILCGLQSSRKISDGLVWRPPAFTYITALLVFVATYYFSVAHSYLALWLLGRTDMLHEVRWHGLLEFILAHFGQESRAMPISFDLKNFTFLDTSILAFFLGAAAVAVYENIYFGAAIGVLSMAFVATELTERRLLPLLCIVPLMGARSFWRFVWPEIPAVRRTADFLFGGIFLAGVVVLVWGKTNAAYTAWDQALARSRLYGIEVKSRNQIGRLPIFIQGSRYPIVTGSWFQLPEASALTGMIFYDRMDEFTGKAVQRFEKVYLLFRPSQSHLWPYTTRDFCGNILLDEFDIVLCEFNKSQSLMKVGEFHGG